MLTDMGLSDLGGFLPALLLAVALSACAGLRAWLPLLMAGGLSRAGVLELGSSFEFISSNYALAVFGLATVTEIAADKIPALDHVLDGISTVMRPAAGTLLAASALGTVSDPLTSWILGALVGTPAALVPHAAKSGLRLASSVFTAGIANPVISILEDVSTVALVIIAVLLPVVVCVLLLAASWYVANQIRTRRRQVVTT